MSNAAWRAAVPPAAPVLAPDSDERLLIEQAERGGLHYLDLSGVSQSARAEIKGALRTVRQRYADGDLIWGDEAETAAFLRVFDGLLAMFDDPTMGRPIWPPRERWDQSS